MSGIGMSGMRRSQNSLSTMASDNEARIAAVDFAASSVVDDDDGGGGDDDDDGDKSSSL